MNAENDQVLAERARIQQIVEGRTLIDSLAETAERYADEPAYSDRNGVAEGWRRTLTWSQTREAALRRGRRPRRTRREGRRPVAVMATNRIEHVLARHGRGARRRDPDVDLQHPLPRAGRLHRRARPARGSRSSSAPTTSRGGATALRPRSGTAVVLIDAEAPEGERYTTWDAMVEAGRRPTRGEPRRARGAAPPR